MSVSVIRLSTVKVSVSVMKSSVVVLEEIEPFVKLENARAVRWRECQNRRTLDILLDLEKERLFTFYHSII